MVEQDWTPSTVMQGHLQKITKQGFMTVAELAACRVPEDPTFPMPVEGYMVSLVAFYEWGFGMPSHRFLYSLLQHCGLELHNLTPSGVLHIVSFVTLCEAYLGSEPHFNLWNYFFHTQLQQVSGVEVAALGTMDIFVRSEHGVDSYFHLLTFGPLDGWWKV
jgi:hypothetical protein